MALPKQTSLPEHVQFLQVLHRWLSRSRTGWAWSRLICPPCENAIWKSISGQISSNGQDVRSSMTNAGSNFYDVVQLSFNSIAQAAGRMRSNSVSKHVVISRLIAAYVTQSASAARVKFWYLKLTTAFTASLWCVTSPIRVQAPLFGAASRTAIHPWHSRKRY